MDTWLCPETSMYVHEFACIPSAIRPLLSVNHVNAHSSFPSKCFPIDFVVCPLSMTSCIKYTLISPFSASHLIFDIFLFLFLLRCVSLRVLVSFFYGTSSYHFLLLFSSIFLLSLPLPILLPLSLPAPLLLHFLMPLSSSSYSSSSLFLISFIFLLPLLFSSSSLLLLLSL